MPETVTFLLIEHVFHDAAAPFADGRFEKIGERDGDIPILRELATGYIYFQSPSGGPPIYVSRDIPAFKATVSLYEMLPPESQEQELNQGACQHFREQAMRIDPNALEDDTTFWSGILEEMQYGII